MAFVVLYCPLTKYELRSIAERSINPWLCKLDNRPTKDKGLFLLFKIPRDPELIIYVALDAPKEPPPKITFVLASFSGTPTSMEIDPPKAPAPTVEVPTPR